MGKKPIGLGFVGCGGHALSSHAKVAAKMPKLFRIAAVFDPDRKAARELASLSEGVFVAPTAQSLLKRRDVDAVIIATPHRFHLQLAEAAVAAGKHVLCEKPLWEGNFSERGKKLLQRAVTKKLTFTSCHPRRFEAYSDIRGDLKKYQQQLGPIMELSFRFFYHHPSTAWKKFDNLLLDHMNHEIDLANFLLGHVPTRLERIMNVFDRYEVIGERADGVSLSFAGSRRLKNRIYRNELVLVFERGRVSIRSVLKNGIVSSETLVESFDTDFLRRTHGKYHYTRAFVGIMKNFAESIRGDSTSYLTVRDLLVNTISCNTLVKTKVYYG